MAGSAYTYAYATMGGFIAWFIGWKMVLEYLVAASTVAVGWSGTSRNSCTIRYHHSSCSCQCAVRFFGYQPDRRRLSALVNIPAAAIVIFLTAILVSGPARIRSFNRTDGAGENRSAIDPDIFGFSVSTGKISRH